MKKKNKSLIFKDNFEEVTKAKVTCKCGHRVLLGNQPKAICSWCNCYVFKNKQEEFKYRLNEQLRKIK